MKMAHWNIYLSGKKLTPEMRSIINTIKVRYEINKPTTANISIESDSFIEGLFTEGKEVKIEMGEQRHDMVEMIKGEVIKTPDGSAADYLSYTIDISQSVAMSKEAKIISYKIPKKHIIASEIIARNGYAPVIDIEDKGSIPVSENPVQNNITDMQYLTKCAEKWDCIWWADEKNKIIYFVDSAKAHKKGGQLKIPNIKDISLDYLLGYRTNNARNNIAKLSWKIGISEGSSTGRKLTDKGISPDSPSTDLEIEGVTYRFKQATINAATKNPKLLDFIAAESLRQKTVEQQQSFLKKYYDQFPAGGSKTNKDLQSRSSYRKRDIELTADLNDADFYLRPPRKARLKAGTPNPKMMTSYLPEFIIGDKPKEFNINMVETTISGSLPKTSIRMTV